MRLSLILCLTVFVLPSSSLAQLKVKPGYDVVDEMYDLQLVSEATVESLPTSGKSVLVIAQLADGALYFKVFNSAGSLIESRRDTELPTFESAETQGYLSDLKLLLKDHWASGRVSEPDQRKVIINKVRRAMSLLTTRELRPHLEFLTGTLNNLSGLSGLLAGFMIAVVFGLVGQARRPVASWTVFISAVSAAGFSAAAFVSTFIIIVAESALNKDSQKISLIDYYASAIAGTLETWGSIVLLLVFFSSTAFTLAIALSGWLYSTSMGVLTTSLSFGAFLLMAGSVVHIVFVFAQ